MGYKKYKLNVYLITSYNYIPYIFNSSKTENELKYSFIISTQKLIIK